MESTHLCGLHQSLLTQKVTNNLTLLKLLSFVYNSIEPLHVPIGVSWLLRKGTALHGTQNLVFLLDFCLPPKCKPGMSATTCPAFGN